MGSTAASAFAILLNSVCTPAWLFNTYASQVNSNTNAAALQIAIWETLYDSNQSLNSGYFTLVSSSDSSLSTQVNSYLGALNTNYAPGSVATWYQPTNPSNAQDMLGAGNPTPSSVSNVPEPGLMSLFAGSSLSGLYIFTRKRRK